MIIANHRRAGGEDTNAFILVSTDGAFELSLQLTDALGVEFSEHLVLRGFRMSEGKARGAVSDVIVATAANPAAWTAVGATVVAFLRRHRGKVHRFEVEGESASIEGYSAREAEKLAARVLDLCRERRIDGGPGIRPGNGL